MQEKNNDDFGLNQNEDSINKNIFFDVLCYIPGINIWFAKSTTKKTQKNFSHLYQGLSLMIIGLFLTIINVYFFILYILISCFFGYKAYKGEYLNIPFLEDFGKKIENLINKK